MQVILLENIKKLGSIGQKVNVKDGYARNYLLKNKKALLANKKNLEFFEKQKEEINKKNEIEVSKAKEILKAINNIEIECKRSYGKWSIVWISNCQRNKKFNTTTKINRNTSGSN